MTVCTWLWGDKYGEDDVDKLFNGVQRWLKQKFDFLCITDELSRIKSEGKLKLNQGSGCASFGVTNAMDSKLLVKGCFARLRMFDPEWQGHRLLEFGDRLVCLDLDTVITGPLDPLFDRPEPLVVWQGANASNPCPYNCSVMMLRAGAHPEIWKDFSLEAAAKIPFFEFPDDQGWIAHKVPNAAGWKAGSSSGIYGFQKPGWPKGDALPKDARIVAFPGWRSPDKFKHLDWIKDHWRA